MVVVTNRWLSLRLELLGNVITFAAAIFAVVGKDRGLNPGTLVIAGGGIEGEAPSFLTKNF